MILYLMMPGDQFPHKVYIVQFPIIHSCCHCSCSWNQYTGEATGISFADIFRAEYTTNFDSVSDSYF